MQKLPAKDLRTNSRKVRNRKGGEEATQATKPQVTQHWVLGETLKEVTLSACGTTVLLQLIVQWKVGATTTACRRSRRRFGFAIG